MTAVLALVVLLSGGVQGGEPACRVFVEPISIHTAGGVQSVRDRIAERIVASGRCTVVTQRELAGAVLSGGGWIRPPEMDATPMFGRVEPGESVLNVELKRLNGEVLWRASLHPRLFAVKVSRNLADQAADQVVAFLQKQSNR